MVGQNFYSTQRNEDGGGPMNHGGHAKLGEDHYRHLALMSLIHFPIMYAVMFSMVYSSAEIFHNLNTFYMAGMMVAPMVFLMPLMMRKAYQNAKINIVVYVASIAIFLSFFVFTREQTFIGDRQFLRSMIPHHSGAVLMCEKARIEDAEIKTLCAGIVRNQKSEIEQMEKILERM